MTYPKRLSEGPGATVQWVGNRHQGGFGLATCCSILVLILLLIKEDNKTTRYIGYVSQLVHIS